jgi:hypothetical protein
MAIVIRLILGAVLAYWIAGWLQVPWWLAMIGIIALYFLVVEREAGHTTAGGFFGGIADIFHGFWRMMLVLAVWTGIMMIGTRWIAVSNSYAFHQFQALGWRPWLWPSGFAIDLLIWVSLAFIAGWIANRAGRGNAKIAGAIFAVTGLLIFLMLRMPTTAAVVLPDSRAAADSTVAAEGVVRPVVRGTYRLVAGKVPEKGVIPAVWNASKEFLVGEKPSKLPSLSRRSSKSRVVYATPPAPVVVKIGKQPTLYNFSDYADGCKTLTVKVHDFYWYPKGGRIEVFPPEGDSFVDTPGVDVKTKYRPGTWRWCQLDPSSSGVEVWQ